MGFMSVGDINYHGTVYTIWVGSDSKLAEASWKMQKSKHFRDYVGPPPAGLPSSAKDRQITESK
jgi:hypothetical protein